MLITTPVLSYGPINATDLNTTRRDGVNPFLTSYMPRWDPSGDSELGSRRSLVRYLRLFAFVPTLRRFPQNEWFSSY